MSLLSPAFTENTALYTAILERGRFFYPAGVHYGNPDASVVCDRCKRSGIKTCIGYDRYDLCLPCVDLVAARISVPTAVLPTSSLPPSLSDPTRTEYLTLMVQDMLRPSSLPVAAMGQTMYRPLNNNEPRTRMEHRMYLTQMEYVMGKPK